MGGGACGLMLGDVPGVGDHVHALCSLKGVKGADRLSAVAPRLKAADRDEPMCARSQKDSHSSVPLLRGRQRRARRGAWAGLAGRRATFLARSGPRRSAPFQDLAAAAGAAAGLAGAAARRRRRRRCRCRIRRAAELEHRDRGDELLGLRLQALGGGGAFLDQRGVLLRGLVHLRRRPGRPGRRRCSARRWRALISPTMSVTRWIAPTISLIVAPAWSTSACPARRARRWR